MKSTVIVKSHPGTNQVLTANPNKDGWSTVRVEQSTPRMNGRILTIDKKVAFITGPTALYEQLNLQPNGDFPVPGKLVVKEQLTPFYEGQQPKIATGTDVPCKVEGSPIFREVSFTENLLENDVYVAHDNTAEIKAAQLALVEAAIGEE